MSIDKAGGLGLVGSKTPSSPGAPEKEPAKLEDAADFADLMKKMKEDKDSGKELDKGDLQSLFAYTFKQTSAALTRQLQENAKQIERENLDKGF